MKVCFDTDGTKTNFAKFVKKYGIPYFEKKYNMEVVNNDGLEIEEIFDIKNTLIKQGKSEEEASKIQEKMLDKFWISHRFIVFSLLSRFRKGVATTIHILKKDGFKVDIDSSRAKTCKSGVIGFIARNFTLMQYVLNGVFIKRENITFYENDEKKITGIVEKSKKEDIILVDDKVSVIDDVVNSSSNIKSICINECYNRSFNFDPKKVTRISGFENKEAIEAVRNLIGKRKYDAIKRIHKSNKFYVPAINFFSPIILKKFNPMVSGLENLKNIDGPIVFAPNHRTTLDPLILTAILNMPIRWAALKRFFDGNDSIFNNNKNFILCKITSIAFKKMEFLPIERIKDNPKPNNVKSIKDMTTFLNVGVPIGIFGEGTTLKKDEMKFKDFNEFDDAFIKVAKLTDAWIVPKTLIWIKELNIDQKLLVEIGKPFKVGEMSIEDALEHYLKIQKENLRVLRQKIEEIKKDLEEKDSNKKLHYSK